jgi:integrase
LISPYTDEEIKKVLSVIDSTSNIGKRDMAILMLAFDTELRAIDITRLCLRDIDWQSGEIHIVQSKTKRPLSLPLHASVMNAVADYILEARPKSTSKEVFLRTLSPYRPLNGANSLDGVIEKYSKLAAKEVETIWTVELFTHATIRLIPARARLISVKAKAAITGFC